MRNLTLFFAVIALTCCATLAQAQNAGIGVMSPLEKLHVSGGSLLLSGVPTSRAGIEFLPLGSAGNAGGRIYFREDNNNNFGFSMGFSGANSPGAILNWEPNTFHISSHSNDPIGQIALTIKRDTRFIGIGTVTPQAKLDIVGTLKISDGTEDAGKVLTSDTSGFATWQEVMYNEADPQVGSLNLSRVPKWNGTELVDGLITDDGNHISIPGDAFINELTIGRGGGNLLSNMAIGRGAFDANLTGVENTALGYDALRDNEDGSQNTAVGLAALTLNTSASFNTGVGYAALNSTTGGGNTAVGANAMVDLVSGTSNVAVGASVMPMLNAGQGNTAVGESSGFHATGDGNIFLGYKAGFNETGSDKLYIDNSDTPDPLIYGDFDEDNVTIHGSLRVTDLANDNAQDSVLVVDGNGTFGYRDAATLGGGGHWAANGNIIYNTNSGFTGIGTSTPQYQFTIHDASAAKLPRLGFTHTSTTLGGLIQMNNQNFEIRQRDAGNLILMTSNTPRLTILANGNVGIGTQSPAGKLTLANQGIRTISLMFNTDDGFENNEVYNTARIQAGWEAGEGDWSLGFLKFDNTTVGGVYSTTMTLKGGNVGIGTTTPQSKLAVNGKITCKEVEVTLVGFPDYVFEDDYQLMPLNEVEAFIDTHGHLPNVPSAKEVEENGLGLGAMNKILLEKVEELTLHLIAKEKQVEELLEELKYQQQTLTQEITRIEAMILKGRE